MTKLTMDEWQLFLDEKFPNFVMVHNIIKSEWFI